MHIHIIYYSQYWRKNCNSQNKNWQSFTLQYSLIQRNYSCISNLLKQLIFSVEKYSVTWYNVCKVVVIQSPLACCICASLHKIRKSEENICSKKELSILTHDINVLEIMLISNYDDKCEDVFESIGMIIIYKSIHLLYQCI